MLSLETLWTHTSEENFPSWGDCDRVRDLLHHLLQVVISLSSSSTTTTVIPLQQLLRSMQQVFGPPLSFHLLGQHIHHQLTEASATRPEGWGLRFPVGLLGALQGWGRPEDLLGQGLEMAARDEAARTALDTAIR